MRWEVINEDDENKVNKGTVVIKKEPIEPSENETQNVAEHDIFGGAVSDSEDESQLNVLEMDENSQNSADDSHLTDSNSMMVPKKIIIIKKKQTHLFPLFFQNNSAESKLLTEFSSEMFGDMQNTSTSNVMSMEYYQQPPPSVSYSTQNMSRHNIESRLDEIELELADLKTKRQEQELKIEKIENLALRQRFQGILDGLLQEQLEKEHERYDLQELLKQT